MVLREFDWGSVEIIHFHFTPLLCHLFFNVKLTAAEIIIYSFKTVFLRTHFAVSDDIIKCKNFEFLCAIPNPYKVSSPNSQNVLKLSITCLSLSTDVLSPIPRKQSHSDTCLSIILFHMLRPYRITSFQPTSVHDSFAEIRPTREILAP